MSKRIAVQEGLDNIKNDLKQLGFEISNINDEHLDAIIYMADGNDVSYHNTLTNLSNNSNNNGGTLLINATDKSVNQIAKMINNKLYSPLF